MKCAIAGVSLLLAVVFIACVNSQSCPGGRAIANTCIQRCNTTGCNLNCSSISGICLQQCQSGGVCPVVNCTSSGRCTQTCAKSCDTLNCQSENCTQICEGDCKKIVCDSQRCTQLCRKGGCVMECTGKTQICNQVCTKKCTLICKAKHPAQCTQVCRQGGCTYANGPGNKTSCEPLSFDKDICRQAGCIYKDCRMSCLKSTVSQKKCSQSCFPPILPCPVSMTCDTEECTQTCLGKCEKAECDASTMCMQQCGGSCKSTRCTSKTCSQMCTESGCAVECAKGTELCNQLCNGTSCKSLISKATKIDNQISLKNCEKMECNSETCLQKCGGMCAEMVCNGKSCYQTCEGESCKMLCPKSVESCTQTCKKGKCELSCEAANCKKNCVGSAECSEYTPPSHAASFSFDLTLLVNALFFVIINVMH